MRLEQDKAVNSNHIRIIRSGVIIFKSGEGHAHLFNCPVQIGLNKPRVKPDTPQKDARYFVCKVETDDVSGFCRCWLTLAKSSAWQIVILATDGLTDNLFDEEILEEVNQALCVSQVFNPGQLAEALCTQAEKVFKNQDVLTTPFQQRMLKENPEELFQGGKVDDITVLVGLVTKA